MSRILTIDIETLPEENALVLIGTNDEKSDEAHRRTALDASRGRILCIGFIDEGRRDGLTIRGCLGWSKKRNGFHTDERRTLTEFWEMMTDFRPFKDRIVGHNIFEFDLKFIYQRSFILGVRPTVDLSFARYRSQPVFDTMCEWSKWGRDFIKLEKLAEAFGLESPKSDDISGAKVYDHFLLGNHELIHDYCLRDVETTRAIYKRMTFSSKVNAKTFHVAA